jgi:ABC-type transport system involved in multi-copper enzyme maturation permease subunit
MAFMSWLFSRCAMWFRTNLGSSTPQEWRERFLAGTWLAAVALLFFLGDRLSLAAQSVGWGLVVLSGALLWRTGAVRLFGPVLFYDLMCLARRGRYLLFRLIYAIVLLLLLTSLYVVWFYVNAPAAREGRPSSTEITRFAEMFYLIFMGAEFLVVLLLTPAYVAGALADEKDRGTLDHMLATDLSNREIVLSKLLARAANLGILVLTGLPILSLTQFFGGIDPNLVLSGFAALGMTMASLACLSILHSVYARKPRDAIVFTYLSAAVYFGLSYLVGRWAAASPELMARSWTGKEADEGTWTIGSLVDAFTAGNLFTVLDKLISSWRNGQPLTAILPGLLGRYALFHGLAALACTAWAVARIRIVALKQAGMGTAPRRDRAIAERPDIPDQPVAWREVFVERGYRFTWTMRLIVALLVVISFIPNQTLRDLAGDIITGTGAGPTWRARLGQALNDWVRVMGSLVACLTLIGVAVRAAGSISGERDRQTLDGLLLTPMRRDDILRGKWLGSILSMRWAWIWLAALWAVAMAGGGLSLLAVPLLMLAWLVFAVLAANIGLYFSITSRTTLRASIATFIALLTVCFGHWLLWFCMLPLFYFSSGSRSDFPDWIANFQLYGMTPPCTFGILSFQGTEFQQPVYVGYRNMTPGWERFFCALVGLICWGIVAIGLGWVNSGRFRREASGEPLHPSEFAGGAHPLSPQAMPVVETEEVPTVPSGVAMSEEWEAPPMAEPVADEPSLRGAVLVEEEQRRKEQAGS